MEFLITISFIFYFTEAYQIFSLGNYGFTYLDASTLLMNFVFLKRLFWDGEEIQFPWFGALTAFILIILSVIFSFVNPVISGEMPLMFQFVKSSSHWFFTISFTLILVFYPARIQILQKIVKIWLIIAIFINIFGAYQIFARAFDLPLAWIDYSNVSFTTRGELESMDDYRQLSLHFGDFYRATSIFSEPSALASFNLFIIIFMLVPYVQRKEAFFKSKLLNGIIFVSTVIGTFLTFSITGLLGLALVISAIFIIEKFKPITAFSKFFVSLAILLVIADGVVVSYLGTSVLDLFGRRVVGILNRDSAKGRHTPGESFEGRLDNIYQSVEIWELHPFFGIGLGNTFYNVTTDIKYSNYTPLALLAETGLIGFIAINWLFLSLFIVTYKFIKFPEKYSGLSPPHQRINGLLFYMMIQLLLTNYATGNNLGQPWLWLPIAFIFSAISQTIIISEKGKIYKLKLVEIPLETTFKKFLKSYLNTETKKMSA